MRWWILCQLKEVLGSARGHQAIHESKPIIPNHFAPTAEVTHSMCFVIDSVIGPAQCMVFMGDEKSSRSLTMSSQTISHIYDYNYREVSIRHSGVDEYRLCVMVHLCFVIDYMKMIKLELMSMGSGADWVTVLTERCVLRLDWSVTARPLVPLFGKCDSLQGKPHIAVSGRATLDSTEMFLSVVAYFPTLKLLKIRSLEEFLRSLKNYWRILQEFSGQRNKQLPVIIYFESLKSSWGILQEFVKNYWKFLSISWGVTQEILWQIDRQHLSLST